MAQSAAATAGQEGVWEGAFAAAALLDWVYLWLSDRARTLDVPLKFSLADNFLSK